MTEETMMRIMCSVALSLAMAFGMLRQYDAESSQTGDDLERQKYQPIIPACLLPIYLLCILIVGILFDGVSGTMKILLSMCFGIVLHISAYYVLVMLLLPFFRRYISARACAMLWIVPNYLYILGNSWMDLSGPKVVLPLSGTLAWVIFGVWLAGVFGVLLWKMMEHLRFRRMVLSDAVPVTDPEVSSVWKQTMEEARMKHEYELMLSPNVTTPLTIGLFRSATKVVLPQRGYTTEELKLILRHELIHVARGDAWSKFFLVFCTAVCWFNPLMWYAMRKSAEDLELSCDESVLQESDGTVRKQYAQLILDTAGDERGFTTCLSASAAAMRYRLKRIVRPVKRGSGALIVGTMFFVLCITGGYVTLAYGSQSGAEVLYSAGDYSRYQWSGVEEGQEQALYNYLSGLTLAELADTYSFSDSEREEFCKLEGPDGMKYVFLYDRVIKLISFKEQHTTTCYYVTEGLDWAYLDMILR